MFYNPRALPLNHSEQSRVINLILPSPLSGRKEVKKEGRKKGMGLCPVSVCERTVMGRKQPFIKQSLFFAFHFTRVADSSPETNGITFPSDIWVKSLESVPPFGPLSASFQQQTPSSPTVSTTLLSAPTLSGSQPLAQSNDIPGLLSLAPDPFQLTLHREVTAVLSKMWDHVPQPLETTHWISSRGGRKYQTLVLPSQALHVLDVTC